MENDNFHISFQWYGKRYFSYTVLTIWKTIFFKYRFNDMENDIVHIRLNDMENNLFHVSFRWYGKRYFSYEF